MKTYFAPPERLDQESVLSLARTIRMEGLAEWFDAAPVGVIALNEHRQIVFGNKTFLQLAHSIKHDELVGLRPGEALQCLNAKLMEGGCGCSTFCLVCGAAIAILNSLRGEEDCQECNITRLEDGCESSLDLQVFTRPLTFGGERLTLLTAIDISHEKRLKYLERRFYHDLINAGGGMVMLTSFLNKLDHGSETNEEMELLRKCSRRMLREVLFMRDVVAAEDERLCPEYREIDLRKLVQELVDDHGDRPEARGARVDADGVDCKLTTDPRLLRHVLDALYRNALEAGEERREVVLSTIRRDGFLDLTISNPGCLPEKVQLKLFKRYVSTKGESRGLGLFLARRIARNYLGGDLTCELADGRVAFIVRLPTNLQEGTPGLLRFEE